MASTKTLQQIETEIDRIDAEIADAERELHDAIQDGWGGGRKGEPLRRRVDKLRCDRGDLERKIEQAKIWAKYGPGSGRS